MGAGIDDLSDPSYPILEAAWEELRATGSFYVTARLLAGSGTSFPAEMSVFGDGEDKFGVIFREVVRREEESPQTSVAEYRALVESSLDAMTICEPNNTIRYANRAWERLLGYKPEELVGMFIPDLIHPDDLPRIATEVVKIENTTGPARPVEGRYQPKQPGGRPGCAGTHYCEQRYHRACAGRAGAARPV